MKMHKCCCITEIGYKMHPLTRSIVETLLSAAAVEEEGEDDGVEEEGLRKAATEAAILAVSVMSSRDTNQTGSTGE